MSDEIPISELLKPVVDTVEDSADDAFEETPRETPPEEKPAVAETPPAPVPPSGEEAPEDDPPRRMTALPKWAHERLRANDERVAAAERRAAEIERQAEAARLRAQELEAYIRGGQDQGEYVEPQQQIDPQAVSRYVEDAVFTTRSALGWDRAVEKIGAEAASQATHWARDRAGADPQFAYALRQQPDPVAFAVTEFRKAQTLLELDQYGGDLDALIQARMKSAAPAAPVASPPVAGDAGARKRGPGDFAGAPSGVAAAPSTDPGPTPLSELLKLRRR